MSEPPNGTIRTWEDLTCPQCSSKQFVALVGLKSKPGGGTTIAQTGWQCAQCQTKADLGLMQRAQSQQARLAELRALEEELGMVNPAVPSATVPTTGLSPSSKV